MFGSNKAKKAKEEKEAKALAKKVKALAKRKEKQIANDSKQNSTSRDDGSIHASGADSISREPSGDSGDSDNHSTGAGDHLEDRGSGDAGEGVDKSAGDGANDASKESSDETKDTEVPEKHDEQESAEKATPTADDKTTARIEKKSLHVTVWPIGHDDIATMEGQHAFAEDYARHLVATGEWIVNSTRLDSGSTLQYITKGKK